VVGSVPVIERQIHQQERDDALHDKVRRHDRRQAPMVLRNALQYAGGDRLHNDERNGKREPRDNGIDDEPCGKPALRLAQWEEPLERKQRQERQRGDVDGIVHFV